MKKTDVDKLKQELLDLKLDLQLQEEEFQLSNEPIELDQDRLGRLSRMDAMQMQQMSLETSRRQQQLVKVDGAISRIETDEYGFCFVCGEEIDSRRLALEPTSTRCLACMETGDS